MFADRAVTDRRAAFELRRRVDVTLNQHKQSESEINCSAFQFSVLSLV